jgi:hypothetical protein
MISVKQSVGRLVELRWRPPLQPEDLQHMQNSALALLDAVPKVYCSDLRAVKVMPGNLFEALAGLFQNDGREFQAVVRSAVLLAPDNAIGMLQQTRLSRKLPEPVNAKSQVFQDPEELLRWLRPVLVPVERARLQAFLQEAAH